MNDTGGTPPKYGYASATPEYDTEPKSDFSFSNITGLNPGTKYYYRAVSRDPLAISSEYAFVTKAVAGAIEEIVPSGAGEEVMPFTPLSEFFVPLTEEEKEGLAEQPVEEEVVTGEQVSITEEKPAAETVSEKGFLAAIGLMPLAAKVILIVIGAIIAVLSALMLFRKKTPKKLM